MIIKKLPLIMIISTIIMCIPTQIFAWLQYSVYEECNIVNAGISWLLKTTAFIIVITYIIGTVKYIKHSNVEKNQKIKNILTWLIITIVQVSFLFAGALWVTEMGMESYWGAEKRNPFKGIQDYRPFGIRVVALISCMTYIITTIIYIAKSKQEKIKKAENVIRWQIIAASIVAGLLVWAENW